MSPNESRFPLAKSLPKSLTPANAFQRLSSFSQVVFLDSSRKHDELGRYSFLCCDPYDWKVVSADHAGQVLDQASEELARIVTPTRDDLPPFQGGLAGLFGYELSRAFERLPVTACDEFQMPSLAIGFFDVVIAFDHGLGEGWIVSQGFPEIEPTARADRAHSRLRQFEELLQQQAGLIPAEETTRCEIMSPVRGVPAHPKLLSNFSKREYLDAVTRTIDYIRAGDIFQANVSQRLLFPSNRESAELYLSLRRDTPSTFGGYLGTRDFQVMSVSPERFLRVHNRNVEARPIKGTRPMRAGATPLADMYSGKALQSSEKDRAENVMIVDLLRNDISRACEPASVSVPVLCGLESYGYVQHLVSVVRGRLQSGKSPLDLLRDAFPGGSITGAPKIRAMEIIAELERVPRGAYCGSLGYVSAGGEMDLNILIRTITAKNGWWQFPVGGGIVADSDPEREYAETWHKAAGLLKTVTQTQ